MSWMNLTEAAQTCGVKPADMIALSVRIRHATSPDGKVIVFDSDAVAAYVAESSAVDPAKDNPDNRADVDWKIVDPPSSSTASASSSSPEPPPAAVITAANADVDADAKTAEEAKTAERFLAQAPSRAVQEGLAEIAAYEEVDVADAVHLNDEMPQKAFVDEVFGARAHGEVPLPEEIAHPAAPAGEAGGAVVAADGAPAARIVGMPSEDNPLERDRTMRFWGMRRTQIWDASRKIDHLD